MNIIKTEKGLIKSWCLNVEESAMEQIKNVSNLPFIYKHVSLMPDAHTGYGCPIGSVAATKGVIVPSLIGVDIGCGMVSYKTDWTVDDITQDELKNIMGKIRSKIPVGMTRNKTMVDDSEMPDFPVGVDECIVDYEWKSAKQSLGTLGGGNHFIEFQRDAEGIVYVMIHSGSRNLGKKICDHYTAAAKEENEKWFSNVNPKADLAFLPINSTLGHCYIQEMEFAVEFARLNRKRMMLNVLQTMNEVLDMTSIDGNILDVAHNYARLENHFGKNVWVHRKGATSARKGELGIIPGSQGTSSYIVRGLGNRDSFMSCSHGAGRTMGRGEAKRTLDFDAELAKMTGIIHTVRSKDQLDESVGSYKDIKEVMGNQADLVEIVTELTPLACIKG